MLLCLNRIIVDIIIFAAGTTDCQMALASTNI